MSNWQQNAPLCVDLIPEKHRGLPKSEASQNQNIPHTCHSHSFSTIRKDEKLRSDCIDLLTDDLLNFAIEIDTNTPNKDRILQLKIVNRTLEALNARNTHAEIYFAAQEILRRAKTKEIVNLSKQIRKLSKEIGLLSMD